MAPFPSPSHGHGAPNSNSNNNNHSDSARMEQIISGFFAKTLHIILESRSPFFSSRDHPPTLQNIDFRRQSNLELLVVDVLLLVRPLEFEDSVSSGLAMRNPPSLKDRFPNHLSSELQDFGRQTRSEKIIERWVVQYECPKSGREGSSSSSRMSSVLQSLYDKSVLLLRSLYLTVRLLPAYRLFRDLSHMCTFNLIPRVLSFVEPFTHREESKMNKFSFTPVETPCGRLFLSVMYQPLLSDMIAEQSTPMTLKFIPDYVGSPIVHPIKRIPSFPAAAYGSLPHSSSHGPYKAMPTLMSLPPHPSKTSIALKKNVHFDDFSPSLIISPAPHLSSPISTPGSHPPKVPLRTESAPDRIPATKMGGFPALTNKQSLVPSPPHKSSRLSISKSGKYMDLYHTDAAFEKAFSFGKNESGMFFGVKTPCNSSPRISVSGSSSRLSFQDDLDESEIDCPFILDDDDMTDTSSRLESFDRKSLPLEQIEPGGLFPAKKSQQAAADKLVLVLEKAPPLCQDFSNPIHLSQASKLKTWRSKSIRKPRQISGDAMAQLTPPSSFISKTTTDALEELRGYIEMKDVLLSSSSRRGVAEQSDGWVLSSFCS